MDKALWKYAAGTDIATLEQPIWSNISTDDMSSLSNIMLKLGQKSPAMATVTRTAVDGSDYVTAGLLVGPRFMDTVKLVRQVRTIRQREKHSANAQSGRERLRALARRSE